MDMICGMTPLNECGDDSSKRPYLRGFTLRSIPRPLSMAVTPVEERYYAALIRQLVDARKRAGISQEDLSARIGVSDAMVAKWEAGMRLPTSYWLMCWAQALNLTIKVEHDG